MNGDGYPDVVVTNNFDQTSALRYLINQKDGTFKAQYAGLPGGIGGKNYFTVELVDVNEDGLPDLFIGGHEWEGAVTRVYINPGNFDFSKPNPTTIPAVANNGVVLDIVVTGSGATRALWINRTSGGDGTFYQGVTIQNVSWPGLASAVPLSDRGLGWIPWIIAANVGGQNVITGDDTWSGVSIPQ